MSKFAMDFYEELIDPLFFVPEKLPKTLFYRHVPICFVLVKITRPGFVVELGMNDGAGLIAANTMSDFCGVETDFLGVYSQVGQKDGSGGSLSRFDASFSKISYVSTFHSRLQLVDIDKVRELENPVKKIDLMLIGPDVISNPDLYHLRHWLANMQPDGFILYYGLECVAHSQKFLTVLKDLKVKGSVLNCHNLHGFDLVFLGHDFERFENFGRVVNDDCNRVLYQKLIADTAEVLRERSLHEVQNHSRQLHFTSRKNALSKAWRKINRLFKIKIWFDKGGSQK